MRTANRKSTSNPTLCPAAPKGAARTATARGVNYAKRSVDNCKKVITRERVSASLTVAAVLVGVAGTVALPVASADTLPNGLTVSCQPNLQNNVDCLFGGCPRVGDYVVDALHVIQDGGGVQIEEPFKCINGSTYLYAFGGPPRQFSFGVQACCKVDIGSDKCTPFSRYTYKPS
jgi:hypothetical protein